MTRSVAMTMPTCISIALMVPQAEAARPVIDASPSPNRAAMLMALLGLVLLGLGMIACVMIGGRWVRKIARERPRPDLAPLKKRPKRTPDPFGGTAVAADSADPGRTHVDSPADQETRVD